MAYLPYAYVSGMYSTLDTVRAALIGAGQTLSGLGGQLTADGLPLSGEWAYVAGDYVLQANNALTWYPATNNFRYYNNKAMNWIQSHLDDSPTASVDMAGIIAAMFDAEYPQVYDFIGLLWAFQQILWDQPFFPDKYAEIVNRIRT